MAGSDDLFQLADAYYRATWQRWPTRGSRAGLAEYDSQLEIPDNDLRADQVRLVRETLRRLQEFEAPAAGTAPWLDRVAFEAQLRLEELWLEQIALWRRNPAEPIEDACAAVFQLLMRRRVEDSDVAQAIVARLSRLPAYLEAAERTVQDPVRLWLEAADRAVPGAKELIRSAARAVSARHPRLATEAERAGEAACAAVDRYREWLAAWRGRALQPSSAIGAGSLRAIVRLAHGLDWDVEQLLRFAAEQIAHWEGRLQEAAAELGGDTPWQQRLAEARTAFAKQTTDLLAEYRRVTGWLREQLESSGLVPLPPGEQCLVMATPEFLRPFIPTAAYSAPGPFEHPQLGIFYVTVPHPDLPEAEYRDNLGQHFGLEATCVHEAYPGHHVQLCWANQVASMVRRLSHHIVFIEGWTLYCEQLVQETGLLGDPLLRLEYLHAQLWRAYRVLIDTSVQCGEMSVEEAEQLLVEALGFSPLRARTELTWYTQSPGTPMSYMLGKQLTLQLRDRYRRAFPDADLAAFHRWLLGFGSVPQRWIEQVLEQCGTASGTAS